MNDKRNSAVYQKEHLLTLCRTGPFFEAWTKISLNGFLPTGQVVAFYEYVVLIKRKSDFQPHKFKKLPFMPNC